MSSMTVTEPKSKTGVRIDRRTLVKALEKVACVIPRAGTKPVLLCVRIEAKHGLLWLAGTNLETSLALTLPVHGNLPRTLVSCRDLLQRVKAGKSPECELWREDDALGINGGAVEHRLPLENLKDFPPIPTQPEGQVVAFPGGEFRQAAIVALTGVAQESTRYAINGVLVEVKKDAHLVATDGRRMVVCELGRPLEADGEMEVILPSPVCQLIRKFVEKGDRETLRVYVKPRTKQDGSKAPSDVHVLGLNWLLSCKEVDGRFPVWRDVVPKGGSKFVLDRRELLSAVQEVSLACNSYGRGIHLKLTVPRTTVSARSPEGSESSGQVSTRFQGGGDDLIVTGFNPEFLVDALETIEGKEVLFEIKQNTLCTSGKVAHMPAVISGATRASRVRWVVMPVSTGVVPSRETLGANYREGKVA